MEQLLKLIVVFLSWYNESLLLLLALVVIYTFYIISRLLNVDRWCKDEIFSSFKNEIEKMIVEFFLVVFLVWFLYALFNIDAIVILNIKTYGKLIFGIWIVYHLYQFHDSLKYWNRSKYIRNVKAGKYIEAPEIIFKNDSERLEMNIKLLKETISILKAFTPMALIPLFAGRLLDGAALDIYIIVFFGGVLGYGYLVWNKFKKLRYLMVSKLEYENELRKLELNKRDGEKKRPPFTRINIDSIQQPDSRKQSQLIPIEEPDGTFRYVRPRK